MPAGIEFYKGDGFILSYNREWNQGRFSFKNGLVRTRRVSPEELATLERISTGHFLSIGAKYV